MSNHKSRSESSYGDISGSGNISSSSTKQKILKKQKSKDIFKKNQNQDIFNKQKDQKKDFTFIPTIESSDDEKYVFVEFKNME